MLSAGYEAISSLCGLQHNNRTYSLFHLAKRHLVTCGYCTMNDLDALGGFLRSNLFGIIALAVFGNWLFTAVVKWSQWVRISVGRKLLEPYWLHHAALKRHNETMEGQLPIYIVFQMARLVVYGLSTVLCFVSAEVLIQRAAQADMSGWLASFLTAFSLAGIIFNIQTMRAYIALKLLYTLEIDPLLNKMVRSERYTALDDLDKAFEAATKKHQ